MKHDVQQPPSWWPCPPKQAHSCVKIDVDKSSWFPICSCRLRRIPQNQKERAEFRKFSLIFPLSIQPFLIIYLRIPMGVLLQMWIENGRRSWQFPRLAPRCRVTVKNTWAQKLPVAAHTSDCPRREPYFSLQNLHSRPPFQITWFLAVLSPCKKNVIAKKWSETIK